MTPMNTNPIFGNGRALHPCRLALFLAVLWMTGSKPARGAATELSGEFVAVPASLAYLRDLGPAAPAAGTAAWTMAAWVRGDRAPASQTLIAGFGDAMDAPPYNDGRERYFIVGPKGTVGFWGCRADLATTAVLAVGRWQLLAACYDGHEVRLFADGRPIARAAVKLADARAEAQLAPRARNDRPSFVGRIAAFRVVPGAMSDAAVYALLGERPRVEAMPIPASPGGHALDGEKASHVGHVAPQPRDTLPTSATPIVMPTRKPKRPPQPPARLVPDRDLVLGDNWEMVEAPRTSATVEQMCRPDFDSRGWYDATVPGTVLTTLVDQGVYPDPTFGLNNMAIPESLCHQAYWYRTTFAVPPAVDRRTWVRFDGINYASEVWLNGHRLGATTGAFIRGTFDVTDVARAGVANVLLVRVSPPPHPGLPFEKSLRAGVGPNGGALCQDGPTFIAAEGWDWVPAIRDRDTGIWQDVVVRQTGPIVLGDPQVVTTLPLPDTSKADVTVRVDVRNATGRPQHAVVGGDVEQVHVEQAVDLAPGEARTVAFAPFALRHPRLWWPNGYGRPDLYSLRLQCEVGGGPSDLKSVRFGVRQFTYAKAPQLTIAVNGHPIMVKGGNWGMDDAMKRCGRARLEPYVRLHRDANLNLIRNWTGESDEAAFYDLCDEYGILVWNDFWMSTAGTNMEPADPAVYLANARDTLLRFRNHPCLAVWCGRNEGVPPDAIDRPLAEMVAALDPTRYYQPNSRNVDLMTSGPWHYVNPASYYTYGKGFSTELGVPSVPTTESMNAMMPPPDRWPISDTWAYHDFHPATSSYLAAADRQFGPSAGLADFDRKAQLLNYAAHRAMFEGWNSHLFAPNSGVIVWMSHPAWPSTVWQCYASDYDPHAAFFGVRKGCEPVHVQLNLATSDVEVVNHRFDPLADLTVTADVYDLDGHKVASQRAAGMAAAASRCTPAFQVAWPAGPAVYFVKLAMTDAAGRVLSDNFYWHADRDADLRQLNGLPPVDLTVTVAARRDGGTAVTTVTLSNPSSHVALMAHASLRDDATGRRVLPVYYDDNYVSLLPGESRTLTAESAAAGRFAVRLDGYNVAARTAREPQR